MTRQYAAYWDARSRRGDDSGACANVGYYVIDKPAPNRWAVLFSVASHLSAGEFKMRRSPLVAGVALITMLACTGGVHAQQPMQRVQIGVLECRGGASVGFVVGSVTNLGCVLRADGMPEDRYVATVR